MPSTWAQTFHAAYDADAAWATANLTTWLVYGTFFAAVANVAVVIAAFEIQRRAFNREEIRRSAELRERHVAAINAAWGSLELFDRVLGYKGLAICDYERPDVVGRLAVFSELVTYYLSQGIIDNRVVSTLITTNTRTIDDLNQLDLEFNNVPSITITRLYQHRATLRAGVEEQLQAASAELTMDKPAEKISE